MKRHPRKSTKHLIVSTIASFGLWAGLATSGIAQTHKNLMQMPQTTQFERIEQPLWLKGVVTIGGLGLIGLELWWFLFSKPKSRLANEGKNEEKQIKSEVK